MPAAQSRLRSLIKKAKAAAPTGIAAANIQLPGTDVHASTILNMFDLDGSGSTMLDFDKPTHDKLFALLSLEVLLLDEVSMIDVDIWDTISKVLNQVDHVRHKGFCDQRDEYGSVHLILFGDFKQLPPATSKPPFIVTPRVFNAFDFRVLRQNRRVVDDETRRPRLEEFHGVLRDVSEGVVSEAVVRFIVGACPFVFSTRP